MTGDECKAFTNLTRENRVCEQSFDYLRATLALEAHLLRVVVCAQIVSGPLPPNPRRPLACESQTLL